MDATPETNELFHLAVAAGFIRHTLKFMEGGSFGDCARHAKAHLASPTFAALPAKERELAEFDIFEFVKGANGLPDGGAEFIRQVTAGDYALCWQVVNASLEAYGYAPVAAAAIDPALLA